MEVPTLRILSVLLSVKGKLKEQGDPENLTPILERGNVPENFMNTEAERGPR